MRYALIEDDKIVGVVNWDGKDKGDRDLRGPLPEGDHTAKEWLGKPAAEVDALSGTKAPAPAPVTESPPAAQPEVPAAPFAEILTPSAPETPAPAAPMTAQQLLDASKGMKYFTLKSEAERILGNKTPNKKADIIAALQRKAKAVA